jgi:AraC-like DNA-binding protein
MNGDLVRAEALGGYAVLVRELGGDPEDLLRRAGIELRDPAGGAQFIPYQKMTELFDDTARILGRADFGLLLAARQGGTSVLGPLEVAMRNSPTLGDAFAYYIDHAAAFSPAVSIVLEEEEETGRPFFRFEMFLPRLRHAQQVAEHAMGLLHHVIIGLTAGKARSRELWFSHGPQSPLAQYRRYFCTRVEMSMPFTALFLSEEDLGVRLPNTARSLFDLADAYIGSEFSMDQPLAAQVRSLLVRQLGEGNSDKSAIAQALSVHPKTLERRLRAEGTSHRTLLGEVRRDAAQRYLTDSKLPMTQIAARLGYSEPAVFTRNCQQWFGAHPSDLRRKKRQGGTERNQ